MKHYYIKYPRDFANEYELFSVVANTKLEAELQQNGFERITRKQAERKCQSEKDRRKYDSNSAYYAPVYIESYEGK